jgi:Flp pilus assembly protein TadD
MTPNARLDSHGAGQACGPHRNTWSFAVAILALTVSGCSGFHSSEQSARQPSLRVANAALASGAPELAVRIADMILAKQPGDRDALIARADALYALGQNNQSQIAYRAVLALEPASVRASLGLGRTLTRSDPRAAEAEFLKALAGEPDNVLALNNLGVVRDLQGRHVEAQEAYHRALAISPESGEVRVNLGMSLALSGHRAEASRLLRVLAEEPGAARLWRTELLAGLALAGDEPWAQLVLQSEPVPAGQVPALESEGRRLASAEALPPVPLKETANAPTEIVPAATPIRGIRKSSTLAAGDAAHAIPESLAAMSSQPVHVPTSATTLGMVDNAVDHSSGGPANATSPVTITPVFSINSKPAQSPKLGLDSSAMSPSMSAPRSGEREREGENKTQMVAAQPIAPKAATTPRSDEAGQGAFVQLGSLLSETDAMSEWHRLSMRLPDALTDLNPAVTRVDVSGRVWWRLRAFGLGSVTEAKALCGFLREEGLRCFSGRGL